MNYLYGLAEETDKTATQISLNLLVQRPTVASIIIGARNKEHLKQNLEALGWNLNLDQLKRLNIVNDILPADPYWHQD